jgi:hypothetical protein
MADNAKIDIDVKINPKTEDIVNDAIIDGLYESIQLVHKTAIEYCPYEHGTLVNSLEWNVDENDISATENTNVEYAVYVEYPDKAKQGRLRGKLPFLRPSLFDNREKIGQIMKKNMDRGI